MNGFIEGHDRRQASLLPACVDDYIGEDALVRIVDAFVQSLDLAELGFRRAIAALKGRPGYHPGEMVRLYIWGYLNQLSSSRNLERACLRDLEAMWLMRRLTPDFRTIAAWTVPKPHPANAGRGWHRLVNRYEAGAVTGWSALPLVLVGLAGVFAGSSQAEISQPRMRLDLGGQHVAVTAKAEDSAFPLSGLGDAEAYCQRTS